LLVGAVVAQMAEAEGRLVDFAYSMDNHLILVLAMRFLLVQEALVQTTMQQEV
jgi:hypothetical protein